MKSKLRILMTVCIGLALCGCQKTLKGNDDLIEKAREEMPITDAENTDISYTGLCSKEESALIWFVSGNEYQEHYYLPMECSIVGINEYIFERVYSPMDRGMDIRVLEWKGGYSFIVNNPNCKIIRITDNTGTKDISIEKDVYPFIYYNDLLPLEYKFLDINGNEL